MAQYYNVVSNPNGTFTIQDFNIDGQSVLVLEDINNGAIAQPILAYATTPDNTEQPLIQQTINLGTHVTTAQLEPRQSVYIIKTNESPAQQTAYVKADSSISRTQNDNSAKGSKEQQQISICYSDDQTEWANARQNNDPIEFVIKKDPTPVKSTLAHASLNTVKNPQQITTHQIQIPVANVIQGITEKKPARLVPLNTKRHALGGQPVGILRTTLQGVNTPTAKACGKMKRTPSLINNPNVSLTTTPRARVSTGGVNVNQLVGPPRIPQPRPPIHAELTQRNTLPPTKNVAPPSLHYNTPEMGHLSERIRQATLKQRQVQNSEQRLIQQQKQQQHQQQPVVAVNPTQRSVSIQSLQGSVQKQRPTMGNTMSNTIGNVNNTLANVGNTLGNVSNAIGSLFTLNRQQPGQQQQLQLQQFQQQQQQLRQEAAAAALAAAQQSRRVQASTVTESVEEPMEVDSCENVVQSDRLNQANCTTKAESEDNSSESFAYLQQEIEDPQTAIVQHQITGNEAKMLVILENGEQRLITFEVPKEDCTVQDLLEQASISSSPNPSVSLVSDPALGINYIVDVTAKNTSREEEQIESVSSEQAAVAANAVEPKTPVKSSNVNPLIASHPAVSPRVPKYISGMLAVCSFCGMSAADFNYCMRCKRKLPENVKAIPSGSSAAQAQAKKEITVTPVLPETFYKKNETQKADREVVTKRGRGRGRGGITRTRLVKEPECLTISSDEEDDNRKHKRNDDSKDVTSSLNSPNSEELDTILDKEPIITNTTVAPVSLSYTISGQNVTGGGREQDALINNLSTYIMCRTVRIGSYKYVPNDKVQLTSSGLKLEVPLLEDEHTFVTVDIKIQNLVKVLIHFAKSMPVLFFYTNVSQGVKIRELLGMQDPKGPYFDPAGKDHTHKRITLLPDRIPDESRSLLKEMYKPIFEELNTKEANDILVRASPKTASAQVQPPVKKQPSTLSSSNSSNGVIQTITVYPPPPAKGGIAINTEDFICLAEDQFLNDVIIDFYLKYLTLEILSPNDHNKTHVFSSYFYKRLTSPQQQAVIENVENLSPAAKRHARVQKWTKNVNIFEKDFVVIPINEHAHWFLAIICFPGLVGKVTQKVEEKTDTQKQLEKKKKDLKTAATASAATITVGSTTITPITVDPTGEDSERDEAEGDEEEMESDSDDDDDESDEPKENTEEAEQPTEECQTEKPTDVIKVPCVLIFDSLMGANRARVVATLRDYLSCEYLAKFGEENIFSKDTIKGACVKVPQQSNYTDCGLYVLQYVEAFFQAPITDYTLPIKTLKTWFEEIVVTRKREEIANLLTELVNNTKGTKTINLPSLSFPTINGELKEKPESQVETRATISKVEKETKMEKDEQEDSPSSSTTPSENSENSNESTSKCGTTKQPIIPPSSSNPVASSSTSTSLIVQKEAATSSTSPKTSTETMAFLKNKRIQRLQKSPDTSDDKQASAAKKHKGESFDICK